MAEGSGSNAGGTGGGNNQALLDLESALLTACETLSSIAGLAVDFSYDNQDLLFSKTNDFVRDLDTIDERAKETTQSVPFEVLEAIDHGKNPEHSTLQVLEGCAEANNMALGKLDAMASFRKELDKQLAKAGIEIDDKAVLADIVPAKAAKTGDQAMEDAGESVS